VGEALRSSPEKALIAVVIAVSAVAVIAGLVGPASGSGDSRPAVETAKGPRADQRAFPRTLSFWKCSPEDEIARRDVIIGYGFCNVGTLRRLNPKGIFLLTPGLFPSNGDEYGGMHVSYGQGLWYWRQGLAWTQGGCDKLPGPVNLGCMRPFNFDWDYMWNVNGTIAGIFNGTDGHRGWNLADPTGKGTRALVARFIAYTAKVSGLYAKGWDGIFSDNWTYDAIGLGWAYGPKLDTDRDGKVDDYETLRKGWNDGLNEVGNRIRSYLPGKIVAGNGSWFPVWLGYEGTDPQGWLKASNATFVEDITGFYDRPEMLLRIASRWLSFRDPAGLPRYVMFQQDALTNSGKHLSIPSTADPNKPEYMLDPGVMRSMRWGLTLALMAGAYYEIIVDDRHATLWWYDEYDGGKGIRRRGYLGQPLGPSVRLRTGGVWRRDFEQGIALNNSTSKSVSIELKKQYRRLRGTQNPRLNDGSVVTRVTLPPDDGLILLNVRQK
jgi:putative glycosyl hydrolase-like family 15 (GHL15) protein